MDAKDQLDGYVISEPQLAKPLDSLLQGRCQGFDSPRLHRWFGAQRSVSVHPGVAANTPMGCKRSDGLQTLGGLFEKPLVFADVYYV